jgi:transposase InsO family protein
MAKKGQTFCQYPEEFKLKAVMKYVNGSKSYKQTAEELGIRNCSQLKVWVKKWKAGEPFDIRFDIREGTSNPLKGHPRTKFKTVEEERDYLKAQVDETEDHDIKDHIMAIHFKHPEFGYPRITMALQGEGYRINHKKVYRLMKELGIQSKIRKKRRYHGQAASVQYPNRLKRQFKACGPNQKLVTDITYVTDGSRFYYFSVIQDLFNNEVVSWKLSKRNDLQLVLDTVDVSEAVLHSDQGFQYTSKGYNSRLEAYQVKGSHSRKGNCLDNACIESFFSHLKTEKLYMTECKSEENLRQAIEDYIYYYNYNVSKRN